MFRLSLLIASTFVFPFFVYAADVCPTPKTEQYPVGSYEEAGNKGIEVLSSGGKCGRCNDIRLTFKKTYTLGILSGGLMTVETTRACRTQADLEQFGCADWCKTCKKEPGIVLVLPDGSQKVGSRCDSNLGSAARAAVSTGNVALLDKIRPPQELDPAGPNKDAPLSQSAEKVIGKALDGAGIKDPDILKKVGNDTKLQDIIAKGGNPVDIDNRLKELGLNEQQRTQLTEGVTALTPGEPDNKNKEKAGPSTPPDDRTKDWDCLVSTNPIYIQPKAYGPGCVNYRDPNDPNRRATTFWDQSDQNNHTLPQNNNKNSSASPFSMGSMLQMLMKNFGNQLSSPFDMGKPPQQNTPLQNMPFTPLQPTSSTSPPFFPEDSPKDGLPRISDIISGRVPYDQTSDLPGLLKPVITMIAQRKEINAGQSISVSWSSVRVLTDPTCTLSMKGAAGDKEIGKGNSGTKKVETVRGLKGVATLTLKCLSLSRQEATASVTVKIN